MSSKDWRGRLLGFPYFDLPRWNHQLHFYPFVLELLKMTVVYGSCLTGLLIFRGKKSKISRDFRGQIRGKIGRFRRIFAGKKSKFAENRPIPRDFRGRKVKIRRKIGWFHGILTEKSQISKDFHGQILRKIGRFRRIFAGKKSKFAENRPIPRDFRGRKVKIRRKIGWFHGILTEKSQISKDFHGQILRKIGRFHGKFQQETLPRNNQ